MQPCSGKTIYPINLKSSMQARAMTLVQQLNKQVAELDISEISYDEHDATATSDKRKQSTTTR